MESEIGPEAGEPSRSTEPGADRAQPWPGYGQAPASAYGYPPYGYGYGSPQVPTGTNGMAIAALVLGICGFFLITPIVGLILGLVSLSAVRRSGQKGKGLAISGIVLSGAWIAAFATLITVAVIDTPDPARRDANGDVVGKGVVSVFDLHPRDCFTMPSGLFGSTDSTLRTFTVAPCSTPHDSEAFGSFTATESSYPGTDALRSESDSQCVQILNTYVPDEASLPAGSRVQFVFPNEQAWVHDEHRVTCFLQFPATLTQSVFRDSSSYTADQLRFLNAFNPLADAVSELNATSKTAQMTVLQQRASDIATAAQNEVSALTQAPWPADVQPSVDALVTQHTAAAQHWAQAAADTDLTSFGNDVRQANADFDITDMNAVRNALGLATITAGSPSSTDQAA